MSTDWLPDSLLPACFRLARADELAWSVFELALDWSSSAPLELEARHANGREFAHLKNITPVPPIIPITFGDAINQLRSSLDNALYSLIEEEHGGSLPPDESKLIAFPIHREAQQFNKWAARMGRQVSELMPGSQLVDRIAWLQPFQPWQTQHVCRPAAGEGMEDAAPQVEDHPLALLQSYSNLDKHRRVHIALARSVGNMIHGTSTSYEEHSAAGELLPGTDLFSVTQGRQIVVDLHPYAAVQRPETGDWVAPGRELNEIHRFVAEQAFPALVRGHEVVGTAKVPPELDLRTLGLTSRQRLAAGKPSYAFDRTGSIIAERFAQEFEKPIFEQFRARTPD